MRGPLRARSNYVNDFAAPYVCARLWSAGRNPYDPASFFPAWRAAGAPSGPVYANPSSIHPVYPPPSILVLVPLALLPWPIASLLLTLSSTATYLAAAVLFTRLIPGSWRDPAKPLFLAYALALAPVHSALHVSNLACLSASLLFLVLFRTLRPDALTSPSAVPWPAIRRASVSASNSGPESSPRSDPEARSGGTPEVRLRVTPERSFGATPGKATALDLPSALLLAVSLCLKPTLAPLFLLFLLATRRFATLVTTILLGALAWLFASYPLVRRSPLWYPVLRNNIHFVFTQGTASLASTNLTRFDRIDLQLPLHAFTPSPLGGLLAAATTAALLFLWWIAFPSAWTRARLHPRTNAQSHLDTHLLGIAVLLLLGLLPLYQRFYSAILLLPLALWSFRNLHLRAARLSLAFCAIFLVNTEVLQQKLGVVPAGAWHLSWFQNAILGPHLNWLLLASVLALLLFQLRSSPPLPDEAA